MAGIASQRAAQHCAQLTFGMDCKGKGKRKGKTALLAAAKAHRFQMGAAQLNFNTWRGE